ncbi:hypothetical protein NC653_001012 [Populus alba x Populus x berolinensis]|uniref:Uncharacterized protein n=1 Tax=Populus alba x Populus x berolinensis TaxID=444605 RepID=A0AAD6RL30_9ROSI|nr:hypothetical protein NC653_001012 [Populus alba x Populus x berolinensis]
MPSHTKIILLLLLLFFIDLSAARVLGVQEGSILPNPPSEVIAEMEMRKLTEVEVMLDYQKDPEPNPKHKPGGNGP